jgi:probable rRNA maturation factor
MNARRTGGGRGWRIDVVVRGGDWRRALPRHAALARRAARAAFAVAGASAANDELSVVLADDAAVRELNRDYRGKDRPTNVLSFSLAAERPAPARAPRLLGDVVLAYETVTREAAAQDKRLDHHLTHLVVHGVLHLLGYDHACDRDAARMEALEVRALARLGVADPYRAAAASRPAPGRRRA